MSRGFKIALSLIVFNVVAVAVIMLLVANSYHIDHHMEPESELSNIAKASKSFWREYGQWPQSLDDFAPSSPNNPKGFKFIEYDPNRVVDGHPVDPWGNRYVYVPYDDAVGFGLALSWGANGEPGGYGNDFDRVARFDD